MGQRLERNDIQGIVASAYTHLPFSAYILLRIDRLGAAAARRWVGAIATRVTAADVKVEGRSLNVALTYGGLKQLGVDERTLATFSLPFIDGMTSDRRARILGDSDAELRWGGRDNPVDILVMAFAASENDLGAFERDIIASATASGMTEVHSGMSQLNTLYGRIHEDLTEHFGFVDGIGQPVPESLSYKSSRVTHDRDIVKDGEFVLDYLNEYGYPAESPRLGPSGKLGRNGSYLVFRQTSQDVPGFWNFVDTLAATSPLHPEEVAAKIVGRWKSGAPLVKAPFADDPAYAARTRVVGGATIDPANDFGFAEDLAGLACPLGSHIRRCNPRDGSLHSQNPAGPVRSERHRLLRRGRSYGPRYDATAANDSERGLHFIALCADLERQFEFVQQTWVNNPALNDLDEVDPLVGGQRAGGTFTVQGVPTRRRFSGMRTFVTLRGGAYFFLPSLAALAWLGA